jgi:UDP-N-acetylmuramoyl-L-alanyl-D-glutamate--2,6-diaminopimelate ligase
MTAMDLAALAADACGGRLTWRLMWPESWAGPATVDIRGVTASTHEVEPGWLFVCIPGQRHDGHDFASEAVARGAVAVVTQRRLAVAVPQLEVSDSRVGLGLLASAHAGWPSRLLDVVGVTGTNGKTSTAHLLAHILSSTGRPCQVRGTLEGALTTPEAPELQRWFTQRHLAGDTAAVVEVSSHALQLERVAGTRFRVGVFTNLGRDHLDFHGTPERYFAAKAKLFEQGCSDTGVVNRDDVHGQLLAHAAEIPMVTFGRDDAEQVVVDRFEHRYSWRGHAVRVPLGGHFHVMNSLAALTTAGVLGVDEAEAAAAVASAGAIRGRFEVIDLPNAPTVVVDFAHTPDGLEHVLEAARALTNDGRLTVVFGCGGDRDAPKRPAMGEVAARLADTVILTSDNPRSEDPEVIIEAIRRGVVLAAGAPSVCVEVDRRQAIRVAVHTARPGDVVVVAGKGHETVQLVGDVSVPFDDVAVVREALGDRT